MADKRIEPPGLMSKRQLGEHLSKYHGKYTMNPTIEMHTRAHHLGKANHSHRSMKLSESRHKDWQR